MANSKGTIGARRSRRRLEDDPPDGRWEEEVRGGGELVGKYNMETLFSTCARPTGRLTFCLRFLTGAGM
jgi:hypothetical protein